MPLEVFVCDAVRTPIGRHGGALSSVRADDLAAIPLRALMTRHPDLDWARLDDVVLGCANQAGEDNRNVARMAGLLAGLPVEVPGTTVNRLCGSGLEAIAMAARAIRAGEGDFYLAGGVESMSRAPYVLSKSDKPFGRDAQLYDTSIGWRFVNPRMEEKYGADALGETAENVAAEHHISRSDQDAFALRSQQRAARAQAGGRFAREIIPVPLLKGAAVTQDEHPRPDASLERLGALKPAFRRGGSVTAGNSSGINDGAAALIVASAKAVKAHGLRPRARIAGIAAAGVAPRIMGMGPVPATQKLLERLGLKIADMNVVEINEAFAAQAIACLRALGLDEADDHINPNGGAIALGHPLGMSGARLVLTAVEELEIRKARRALCTMCVGVGQGVSTVLEAV